MVEAKIGVMGSRFKFFVSTCPRYSGMNWQSKSKYVEGSFQLIEKVALGIDSMMRKSSVLSTNGMHTKVYVSGEESKEKIVLASQKSIETDLENDRQAMIIEKLPERGLTNVPTAAQEQGGLQKCTLSADLGTNVHGVGLTDVSDADEHSDIFDDIFDSDDASSSKNEQNKFKKCSLSDLVRQYTKAFSFSKREREATTSADNYEWKGERSLSGKEYKPDHLDVSTRRTPYRAERVDSFMEEEDRGMLPHQSGGGRPSAYSSMGMTWNQSYNYKAGMGGKHASGRNSGGDRPRSKSRQQSNKDRYSDAECEEGEKYFSARVYGNERPRYKESKAGGGYADESRGGFEGKRRYEGRARR